MGILNALSVRTLSVRTLSMLGLSVALAMPVMADRVDHFSGKSAETLGAALDNFNEYNALLADKLSGELTDDDLVAIHQLTYTLENALEKINQELGSLAEVLEEVHIASESFDREALAEPAREYLRVITILEQ